MLIEEIKNIKSDKRKLREFGFVVGGVLAVIAGIMFWKRNPNAIPFLIPALALIVSGLLFPSILLPLQKIWMTLALVMGLIMSKVILTVLFFFVMTPIGLIAKCVGKKFLDLKIDKAAESYWIPKQEKMRPKEFYEKQF